MSDRYCPFLESSGNLFGASYRCKKTEESIDSGSSLYDNYCANWESNSRGTGYSECPHMKGSSSGSGCFLTSACIEAMGLPDDCDELTTLRQFRDGWLKNQPFGQEAIWQYYAIAPQIVNAVRTATDSKQVYRGIYDHMIMPCVQLIRAQKMNQAYETYRQYTAALAKQYGVSM